MQDRLQKDSGFPCRKAAKKPLLTESMKKQRIAIAKQHVHWTHEQWKNGMFSDESNFQVFRMVPPWFDTHHHLIDLIPVQSTNCWTLRFGHGLGNFFWWNE